MDLANLLPGTLSSTFLAALTLLSTILTVTVLRTILRQVLFKNPNEPPVVFHWLPVIGSTVTYGIDPYKFFFDCQAKVCGLSSPSANAEADKQISMETSSPSFSSVARSPCTLGRKAINSY